MLAQKLKVAIQGLKCHSEMGFNHRVEGTGRDDVNGFG